METTRRSFIKFMALAFVTPKLGIDIVSQSTEPETWSNLCGPPLSQESLLAMYDNILKEFYLPEIGRQLQQESLLTKLLINDTPKNRGSRIIIPMPWKSKL